MGQPLLSNILVELCIIAHHIHSLHDVPSEHVQFPTHNRETVQTGMVTSGVGMVISGNRCPEMFL